LKEKGEGEGELEDGEKSLKLAAISATTKVEKGAKLKTRIGK